MIIDFQSRTTEVSLHKYDVEIQLHPRTKDQETIPDFIERMNIGERFQTETAQINDDEIAFDKNKLEYFRYALLGHIEHVQKGDPDTIVKFDPRSLKTGKIESFLFAEFGAALNKGHTEQSLFTHVSKAVLPIPRAFHIFLPDPDTKNPSREDVLSALIPFRKALREVYRRETNDTAVITIRNTPALPGIILPAMH